MKIKSLFTIALAATTLFSCSKDGEDVKSPVGENASKVVTLKIKAPSTYAEEAPADGVTPTVNNLRVFFVGSGLIQEVGTMTSAELGSAKTFTNVPGAATDVIIIGNDGTNALSASIAGLSQYDPQSSLDQVLFRLANQGGTGPADVNIYGKGAITYNGTDYEAAVDVAPAISRIEIGRVEASSTATIQLDNFDLTGIYINNTYMELGTDYKTKPSTPASIINYGQADAVWSTPGTYQAGLYDEPTGLTGLTSYTPSTPGDVWAYYVMPVEANDPLATPPYYGGTVVDGEQQSAVPFIVLKIENAAATGYTLPNPAYVSVKKLYLSGTEITSIERGKAYEIASIALGGEHLSAKPNVNTDVDLIVTATLKNWEGVNTGTDFD